MSSDPESKWSEFRSWAALVIAGIALGLNFAQSPFSNLNKPYLTYTGWDSTKKHDADGTWHYVSHLSVKNDSSVAAKNVFIRVVVPGESGEISVDLKHTIEKHGRSYHIEVPVIPPHGTCYIWVKADAKEYPNPSMYPPPWEFPPRIYDIYTEHGIGQYEERTTN